MIYFTFESKNSKDFALIIGNRGSRGDTAVNTFANVSVISDRAGRRIAPFIHGSRIVAELTFPLEIYSADGRKYGLDDVRKIQRWLFGRQSPQDLTIMDETRGTRTYNCFLTNPQQVTSGNMVIGWRFTVHCTAPYGLGEEIEAVFDNTSGTGQFEFNNLSDIEDYLHPLITIQSLNNTAITIENTSDTPDRTFEIKNLTAGNIVTVNNDTEVITETASDNPFNNFNLNWLRLTPGKNSLNITGQCIITLKTRFKLAIGGY